MTLTMTLCRARLGDVPVSLFEFAGGEPALLALATAHHARCLADPELNHPLYQPGQHPQHWNGRTVADVLTYFPVDATPPEHAPMPHWPWTGLEPAGRPPYSAV